MNINKRRISPPKEMTVSFNPLHGFNDKLAPIAGGYVYAEQMRNLNASDGTLVTGEGIASLPQFEYSGAVAKYCYLYKRHDDSGAADNRIIIYTSDNVMCECAVGGGTFTEITDSYFDEAPIGVCYNYNGRDVMIFSDSGGGIRIYDGEVMTEVPEAPQITSMCIHYERLFVATGNNELWFSDDFDPANWNVSLTEAGFINMNDLNGELIKIVSFGDYLYAFKNFGITRISAYTDQRQFSATDLFVSSGKIYKDSIVVCGDCMIFTATDGIYRFDGVNTRRISDSFKKRIDFGYRYFKGGYFNGNAYMRVRAKSDDEFVVQIMKLDLDTGEASFIHGPVLCDFMVLDCDTNYKLYGINAVSGKLCELTENSGMQLGLKPYLVWENGESDFGVPYEKTLTKLSVYTNKDIKITVFADGAKKQFSVKGSEKAAVLKPYMRGVKFKLRFDGRDDGAVIASPKLTLEYY